MSARRLRAPVLLCLAAVMLLATRAGAQNPPAPAPDTTRPRPAAPPPPAGGPDTTRPGAAAESTTVRPDSVLPDSLSPDSLRPVLPPLGPSAGPLPQSRRYVFTTQDQRWSGALSLGELLRLVPGVFLMRDGWFGQPEVVAYAGQGAAAIEIYWDGFAVEPLGLDRRGFDLSRFNLGLFRRIEVEVTPTVLRIYLVSDTPYARHPRTEVSFSTGDAQTNAYRVRYMNRWASGFGFGAGVTYLGSNGPVTAPGHVGELGLWGKAIWMPSDRVGVEYQVQGYNLERDALVSQVSTGLSLPGVSVRRTDSFLRTFIATRADGMGLRFDAQVGASTYRDTSKTLNESVSQASAALGYRAARWSADLTGRLRDGSTPFDVQARAAWSPVRVATLSALGRRQWILGGGRVLEADAGAELRLLDALRLHGATRWRQVGDTERVLDWSAGASLEAARWLSLDAALGAHNPFEAPAVDAFAQQVPAATVAGATTATVSYAVRPWRFLTFSGWYRHPFDGELVAFEPPHHSLARVTFRSAFLPHFRRGAFDVMGQLEVESWGTGTAGLDSLGVPLRLQGESIWSVHVQFRLVGAIFYYTMRNTTVKRYQIIPGFEMPRGMQRFGIVWEFTN